MINKLKDKTYTYVNIDNTSIKLPSGIYFLKGKDCFIGKDGQPSCLWRNLSNKWYYLNENLMPLTGWQKYRGYWYLLDDNDGCMKTGWQKPNGYWYFLGDDGSMRTGWQKYRGYWYLLGDDGSMRTGWQVSYGHWYFLGDDGSMRTGWCKYNNSWYYLDENGAMVTGLKSINGAPYYFNSNGAATLITANDTNSQLQYNLFNYMMDSNNQESVLQRAIALHGGTITNNCVFFTSEALRRLGVYISDGISNIGQLEPKLKSKGFTRSYNLDALKPGDIVFAGSSHVFIFMGWYDTNHEYAYIVDNQKRIFGSTLHIRNIKYYDPKYDTSKATHFYYHN